MTEETHLSPHLVALIQNIHLNEEGWSSRGLRSLILGILTEQGALSPETLTSAIVETGYALTEETLERALGLLKANGYCSIDGDKISLNADKRPELEAKVDEYLALESDTEQLFFRKARAWVPGFEPQPLWDSFRTDLLLPMARDLGANTLYLFKREAPPPINLFRRWLQNYSETNHEDLRALALDFFSPDSQTTRDYILRIIDAALVVQASGLTGQALESLAETVKPEFTLILDTNFIFSLLELHSNPANDATHRLHEMRRKISPLATVNFVVVPLTISEAKRALLAAQTDCESMQIGPKQAKVVLETGFAFTGLVMRYLEILARHNQATSPEAHFGPYLRTMKKMLEAHSVSIDGADVTKYLADWFVRKDLDEQKAFYDRIRQPKKEPQIRHDVLLWHHVKRRRGARAENAVDAKFWLLTVDHTLVGFDRFRTELEAAAVPVCVHPSTVLQLLQFWVPRSQDLDIALMEALRLPFLFSDYDKDVEEVSLRILRELGDYQARTELPEEVLVEFLMDKDLRRRMKESDGSKQERTIVEKKMAQVLADREGQVRKLASRLREVEGKEAAQRQERMTAEQTLTNTKQMLERKEEETLSLSEKIAAQSRELERLCEAETRWREQEKRRRITAARRNFLLRWFVGPALVLTLVYAGVLYMFEADLPVFPAWLWALSSFVLILSALAWVAEARAVTHEYVRGWQPAVWIFRGVKWLGTIPLTLLLGVGANWLWSIIQTAR